VTSTQASGLRIAVVQGTTRQDRFSQLVSRWVVGYLSARREAEVELIDLRDYPLPFFDEKPPALTGRDYPSGEVAELGRALDRADGYVILTAEYNHGYPAVLKNALDWTFVEWRRKPISFVGWGNVGGARAIEQLREVAVEFEMAPLRHAVHILPDVMRPARTITDPDDVSAFATLEPKLAALAEDLTWWMRALSDARLQPTD
jgi:NAD(P)H-dependent FMN reductase